MGLSGSPISEPLSKISSLPSVPLVVSPVSGIVVSVNERQSLRNTETGRIIFRTKKIRPDTERAVRGVVIYQLAHRVKRLTCSTPCCPASA